MPKIKETDRAYANGVKDGFSAGIKASIDLILNYKDEYISNEKYSLLGKAALTIFASKLITELSKRANNER